MGNKERVKKFWDTHPEYREAHRKRKAAQTIEHQIFIAEYLRKHPCVDCNETDIVVLQFDHLQADKGNRDVTGMGQHSRKRILAEIAKCEIVCANCHARRTAQRANTLRWRMRENA